MKTAEEILSAHKLAAADDFLAAMEEYKNQFVDFDGPIAMIDHYQKLARHWENAHAKLEEKLRIQYDAEFEAFKTSFENRTVARKDQLEEWLTEYRDELKKGNVYHKNQGIINAINELLDGDQNEHA